MKRIFDFSCCLVGLVILSPIIVLIWVLLKLQNIGSPIFAQERIGKNQDAFTCYKFRTMAENAPQAATHEVATSHITPLGRTLRKYKLDELPQLWNVIKGDMSLVGPRPCLPVQRQLISEREKRNIYSILPGITGLAQIRGVDMQNPEFLAKNDAEYMSRQSFFGDLAIIFKTLNGAKQ